MKGAQGEFARRLWRECCKVCLEGAMGPPAAEGVGGASLTRRCAQAADHSLVVALIHVRDTFSSKKDMVPGVMSEARMLAASPMRNRWAKLRSAKHVTRTSAGVRALSARKRRSSVVAHN